MYKPLLAALIAATALVPPTALAQGRGNWRGGERSEAPRSEARQARQEASRPSGDRGAWRQQQQQSRQAAPQPQAQPQQAPQQQWRGNNGGQGQAQWRGNNGGGQQQWQGNRGQNGGTPQVRQPQQQTQQAQRSQWNGQRGDGQRGQWNNGQRGQGQRGDWNNGQRGQGQRGDWNNGQRGQGQRAQGQQRRYNDWRDDSRWQSSLNDRRSWGRNWRSDNRYDWRGYRNSNRNHFRLPRYYAPSGWGYGYSRFSIGYTLASILFAPEYWINDPYYYRLPEAYGPYRWVRYYNDALLVDIRTGMVVDVINDIFW